jgi:hypothetical protein
VLLAVASAAAFLVWGEERRERRTGSGAGA